ncbi:MAG TPA: YceI family protein [Dokdonella sp.]
MIRRIALAAAVALVSAPAFAATYTLDPAHTQVVFSWNHFGFSNPSAQFGKLEGTLSFDQADPTKASVTVQIPLSSVNTNVPKLDEHLQAAEFFDAAKFPNATFKSTRVERGAAPDRLKVTGDLTLHGVTKPVTLDVVVNKVGEHPMRKTDAAGFDATATIKRSDFGITKYVPMVSDEIKVRITAEAIAAGGGAPKQ